MSVSSLNDAKGTGEIHSIAAGFQAMIAFHFFLHISSLNVW